MSAVVNGRLATGKQVSLIVIVAGSLACAAQLAYASVQALTIALVVTVIEVPASSPARWSARPRWRGSSPATRSGG